MSLGILPNQYELEFDIQNLQELIDTGRMVSMGLKEFEIISAAKVNCEKKVMLWLSENGNRVFQLYLVE